MQENIFLIFTMMFGGFCAGFFSQDVFKYIDYKRRARFVNKLVQERQAESLSNASCDSPDNSPAENKNAQESGSQAA